MRVVAFSDSHGSFDALFCVMQAQPQVKIFLHLGDGESEACDLRALYPQKQILFVRGNCDWGSLAKDEDLITVAGKRIFFAHGHTYDVKQGPTKLIGRAHNLGADIACFGHTHSPLSTRAGNLYLFNPGSVDQSRTGQSPSYATIDINPEFVRVNIVKL